MVSKLKTINVVFTDEEHEELAKTKGNKSWHDFILELKEMNKGCKKKKE